MDVSVFSQPLGNVPAPRIAIDARDRNRPEISARSLVEPRPAAALIQLAVISKNKFFRTCLARCLAQTSADFEVSEYDNAAHWIEQGQATSSGIVLLCADGEKATETLVDADLDFIVQSAQETRVIIVSDFDRSTLMIRALEKGAKGFVTANLDLDVVIGAVRLVNVGGLFVPASGLISMRTDPSSSTDSSGPAESIFTARQLEVLEYVRVGDPNKIIAHKMKMSEATVKIHVRNMMRKLKSNNRTELVCKSNELLGRH